MREQPTLIVRFPPYFEDNSYFLYHMQIGVFELDDSPLKQNDSFLVIKQSQKSKMAKERRREIGFEYDADVTSDTLLCQKILESNSYNPTFENMIDFSEDLSRIIVT